MSSFLEAHDLAKSVGANEYYNGCIAQAARGLKPRIDHDFTRPWRAALPRCARCNSKVPFPSLLIDLRRS